MLVGVGVGVLLGGGVTGCVIIGVGVAVGVKFTIPLSPPNAVSYTHLTLPTSAYV